jgi:hypothetical protein
MPTERRRQEEVSLPHKLITDGFDEVAKGLAAGTISRGRALKLTGTALLGGGLLAMFPGVAGAQSSIVSDDDEVDVAGHNNPGCKGEAAISNRGCPFNICGRKHYCQCAETADGNKRCVDLREEECPRRNQCNSSRQCPGNQYCIKTAGCCGERFNACVPPCGG